MKIEHIVILCNIGGHKYPTTLGDSPAVQASTFHAWSCYKVLITSLCTSVSTPKGPGLCLCRICLWQFVWTQQVMLYLVCDIESIFSTILENEEMKIKSYVTTMMIYIYLICIWVLGHLIQLTYVNVLIGIMHIIHRVMLDRTTFDTLSEKY